MPRGDDFSGSDLHNEEISSVKVDQEIIQLQLELEESARQLRSRLEKLTQRHQLLKADPLPIPKQPTPSSESDPRRVRSLSSSSSSSSSTLSSTSLSLIESPENHHPPLEPEVTSLNGFRSFQNGSESNGAVEANLSTREDEHEGRRELLDALLLTPSHSPSHSFSPASSPFSSASRPSPGDLETLKNRYIRTIKEERENSLSLQRKVKHLEEELISQGRRLHQELQHSHKKNLESQEITTQIPLLLKEIEKWKGLFREKSLQFDEAVEKSRELEAQLFDYQVSDSSSENPSSQAVAESEKGKHSLSEEIISLNVKLSEVQFAYSDLKNKRESDLEKLRLDSQQLLLYQQKISQLERENGDLRGRIQDLQQQAHLSESKATTVQSNLSLELDRIKQQLQVSSDHFSQEADELKKELEKERSTIQMYQEKYVSLDNMQKVVQDLEEERGRRISLETVNDKCNQQLEALKERLKAHLFNSSPGVTLPSTSSSLTPFQKQLQKQNQIHDRAIRSLSSPRTAVDPLKKPPSVSASASPATLDFSLLDDDDDNDDAAAAADEEQGDQEESLSSFLDPGDGGDPFSFGPAARRKQKEQEDAVLQLDSKESLYAPVKDDETDLMVAEVIRTRLTDGLELLPPNFRRISRGKYLFGSKKITIITRNGQPVVRVGGGFMNFKDFVRQRGRQECAKIENSNR